VVSPRAVFPSARRWSIAVASSGAATIGECSTAARSAKVYRECTIYTTLSPPCAICSDAILLYGILRVIVGENRTILGEEALLRSRGVSVEVRMQGARS